MTNFKKTYTLIQHTPILHFQHAQGDVVLRATEVKPKLDKYLIHGVGGWECVPIDWRGYQEDQQSLDYKIKIWIEKKDKNSKIKEFIFTSFLKDDKVKIIEKVGIEPVKNSPYFADAENIKYNIFEECKKGLFYSIDEFTIYLSVQCFDDDLRNEIDETIGTFFLSHNFGTRQSKGFGSFTVKDCLEIPETHYSFSVDLNQKEISTFSELFGDIDTLWKALRSGINDNFKIDKNGKEKRKNGIYFKSILFRYAKNVRKIQWDKKTIKENFFLDVLMVQKEDFKDSDILTYSALPNPKKRLIRDMLGLATDQKWQHNDYNNSSISKTNIGGIITRFKSPITFKPINENGKFKVYLLSSPIPEVLYGQSFKLTSSPSSSVLNLEFPHKGEVSIIDFLEYAFCKYEGNSFFEKDELNDEKFNYPKDPKFIRLKKILNEIRTNANPKQQ